MPPRRYGHIRDEIAPFTAPQVGSLLATSLGASVPNEIDWSRFVDFVRDQTITSSCVGQALARAVHLRAATEDRPIVYPSALEIYTLARCIGAGFGSISIRDEGCQPGNAITAIRYFGICSETRWPFAEERVNDSLSWDVIRAGVGATVSGYYRIDTQGSERCSLVRQALAQGYPIAFGMDVDQAYEDGSQGPYQGLTGPILGQHMQCLLGYNTSAFKLVNSWGPTWNEGGYAWLSDAWIGSDHCFDFYALTLAPDSIS